MSFHHPQYLWLLALPVMWGFWQWVRRGHPVALPFDHGGQKEGRALRFLTNLAGTLPALLLAIAVLMLAGPRKPAPPQDERVLNNIILCLDVSGSMSARFGSEGTRFEAAVKAAREFCSFRKGDAFGLTVFGSEYIHWVPPTKELSAIISATEYVRPDNMPPWMGGTLIANALGTPPADMIKHIHDSGRKVAALCGSPAQARKHAEADVDIIIAQGGEGGGHCGEVGSIVLWPQVVKEVAPRPVLAAGGIGSGHQIAAALAMGAQGAWTGSQWLMVEEAENTPVQQATYAKASSRDTVRSRSFTGKPCRMLRNDWTDAWQTPGNPEPLGMPLQYMVSGMAVAATHKFPDQTIDVAFNPIGQVVGQFTKVEKTAAVIERWVQEYLESTNTLNELNEAASV